MGKSLNQAKANAIRYTKKKVEHWQLVSLALAGYDAISIIIAFFLALWFRFDCRYSMIPKEFLGAYLKFIGIYVIFSLFVFWRISVVCTSAYASSHWPFFSRRHTVSPWHSILRRLCFRSAASSASIFGCVSKTPRRRWDSYSSVLTLVSFRDATSKAFCRAVSSSTGRACSSVSSSCWSCRISAVSQTADAAMLIRRGSSIR